MTKQRAPLFERLKKGLDEALQHARGEITLRTAEVSIPNTPKAFTASKVQELRLRLKLSQSGLAKVLIVTPKTVQSWEQGRRTPSGTATRLLQLLDRRPSLIQEMMDTTV